MERALTKLSSLGRTQNLDSYKNTTQIHYNQRNSKRQVLQDKALYETDLRQEIKSRIEKLNKIRSFITNETRKFIMRVEKESSESIRVINEKIKQYSNFYLKFKSLKKKSNLETLYSLFYKNLDIVYYPLENFESFYNNQFIVEQFKIMKITETRKIIQTLFPYTKENPGSITCVAVSNDESRVAFGKSDNKIVLYDNLDGKLMHEFVELETTVQSVHISNDNKYLSAGLVNRNVLIWSLVSMKIIKIFQSLAVNIKQVLFTNDLNYLVCTGNSGKNLIREVRKLNKSENFETYSDSPSDDWLNYHPEVV